MGAAGVNIGGGKSKRDIECDIRETSRLLAGLGEVKLAVELACQTEAAKMLPRCGFTNNNVYLRVNENHPPAPPVTVHIDDSSKAQEICDESVDRAFEKCVAK